MSFIGIYKAVYSYEPQAEQELAIEENDILYLLEKSDIDDWWTVKKRVVGADVEEPVGLVPSNYIEPASHIGTASALFDYDKQTDEELTFKESDQFEVYDDKDPDWILVKKHNQEEYGFVPSNYIELRKGSVPVAQPSAIAPPPSHPSLAVSPVQATSVKNDRAEDYDDSPSLPSVPRTTEPSYSQDSGDAPPPKPARPGQQDTSRRVSRQSSNYSDEEYESRSIQRPERRQKRYDEPEDDQDEEGELYTWQVSEVDGRKKKKAMLAIGNNTIYFSPDSVNGRSPQQWKIKDLLSYTTEKKHLFFEFRNPLYSLELHAGSKDVAAQISTIVNELKGSVSTKGLKEVKDATQGKGGSKKKAKILYDFDAQSPDELTVFEGDFVYIVNDSKSKDWWMVEHADTHKIGVVPAQFVSPVQDKESSGFVSKFLTRSKSKSSKSKDSGSKSGTASPKKRPSHNDDYDEPKPQKLEGPKASRVRTWQDRTGTFKVDAEFLGVVEGKVHLHKTNGVKIAVAATKLSLVDLEYVERVTGMSLESYKASKSSKSKTSDSDRERNERRERERKRRERDQRERERDQREREEDDREREKERARWDKAREKEYREREKERAERERDRRERERESIEREKLRQDLDEAKQLAAEAKRAASAGVAVSSTSQQPPSRSSSTKPRESYDWFEFFLEAGVDVNQCQRYSNNFVKEEIDPNILESIDSSVLRTLGLKEGDIIRVTRYIDTKYNRQPKDTGNNGSLFSEPSGALKVNRTGSSNQVGNSFPKASESKQDDDAWTVKPAANNESNNLTAPLTQQFTGSLQDLVNLKPLQPTATASSVKSNVSTYAPTPSTKVLEPTKTGQSVVAPQRTGQITAQPTGLVPLDPFKTGGGNILPMSTGGAFVYLPVQQTGILALQPTGLIPLQKTGQGALPLQATGLVPLQKTGGQITGGLPTFGNVLPLQRTGGLVPSLPPTTFGQLPLQKTGPILNPALTGGFNPALTGGFNPALTGGLNPALTGGLPQQATSFGTFNQQPIINPALTGGLPQQQTSFGLPQQQQPFGLNQAQTFNGSTPSFNQPINNFNGGSLPQTSFSTGINQFPNTFNAQPQFNQQQPQFNQQQPQFNNLQQSSTGFQSQPQPQQFGFNNQVNQLQNQFQNTSISSPPSFNNFQQQAPPQQQQPQFGNNQFGNNQFGQPQPQQQQQPFGGYQAQPSFGQAPQASFGQPSFGNSPQPLEAQPTGFGFGNNPISGSQRANLANASAENPFGF